jgi:hypothetical protein
VREENLFDSNKGCPYQAAILNTVLTQQSPFPGLSNVIQVCNCFPLFPGLCKLVLRRSPCATNLRGFAWTRAPHVALPALRFTNF